MYAMELCVKDPEGVWGNIFWLGEMMDWCIGWLMIY